jgi:hypothetical protein
VARQLLRIILSIKKNVKGGCEEDNYSVGNGFVSMFVSVEDVGQDDSKV